MSRTVRACGWEVHPLRYWVRISCTTAGVTQPVFRHDEGVTGDVTINLDSDTAAVLLDWLQREDAVDGFKWAAARPGDRVALKRVLNAARDTASEAVDASEARQRLEATLPRDRSGGIPEAILRHAPEHIRRRLPFPPPDNDIVSRVAERLEMLGASHPGGGWQADGEHGYVEVGLDPFSEDIAQRIRLMCEPVEVRFTAGPLRPRWPFGRGPDD